MADGLLREPQLLLLVDPKELGSIFLSALSFTYYSFYFHIVEDLVEWDDVYHTTSLL